ncbi:MAG: helix-turn-helix domain-containing protein [Firmicutes bacterium]|nr:helix-turn-helix domain-containing protein [Bacillota bacterium]
MKRMKENKFSQRVKELREEKGLSIMDLARALNTSHANVGRWERGERNPTVISIIMICQFFDVSADYLIGLRDD